MRRFFLSAVVLLGAAFCLHAQRPDNGFADHISASVVARYSYPINAHDLFERVRLVLGSYGMDAYAEYNTLPGDGSWWAEAYNYPRLGVGLSWDHTSDLQFKERGGFGDFINLSARIQGTLWRGRVFSFGPMIVVGVAWSTRNYGMASNPCLTEIGSHVLGQIGCGMEFRFRVSPRWEINLDCGLAHHSNGMTRVPNWGLNQWNVSAGVRRFFYDVPDYRAVPRTASRPDYPRGLHANVYAAAGVHSCDVERLALEKTLSENTTRPAEDLSVPARARVVIDTEMEWRYAPLFSTALGVEAHWSEQRYRDTDLLLEGREDPRGYSPFMAALYLSQAFHYSIFSIHVQVGTYVFRRTGLTEDVSTVFERLGLRCRIPGAGGLFACFDMRAHSFDRSYCLETGIGYSF